MKIEQIVIGALAKACDDLEKQIGADVICIKSPIFMRLDNQVRIEIERLVERKNLSAKKAKGSKRDRLAVVLETNGGYIEVVERISNVFRKHYSEVDFIVPNYAYSAGTVLALSGDRIWMDYYSVLGPIDPQIEKEGKFIPGMGYLYKYQQLMNKKNLSAAEMLYLVKHFNPAELFLIEQSQHHSAELIKEWLVKYKLKNWRRTKTNGRRVTLAMKKRRAGQIAGILGNAERWHSHGRGLSVRELTGEEIRLEIDDFGQDAALNEKIQQYYHLFTDCFQSKKLQSAIHTLNGLVRIG